MIQIKNLHKTFGNKTVFDNFNLTVQNGEFIVFSGQSGCGKTTLLNMIGALESFNSGEILVDGIDIAKKKNHILYFQKKIGFLFQNFALVDHKTVRQNMMLIKKESRSSIGIEEALAEVGLSDKLDQKVYSLSGGEQQRVALARLLMKKCDIVFADEPTGSLDRKNALHVIDILKKMNKSGKTIILVTHDEEMKQFGSRVVNLG